jgi:hypothetical protein
MTIEEHPIPAEREATAGRFNERRAQLNEADAAELLGGQRRSWCWRGRHLRRRTLVVGFATLVLVGGVLATPAFGVRNSVLRALHIFRPAPPDAVVPASEIDWRKTIFVAGRDYPQAHFDNPPESVLRDRLEHAAAQFHFTVERVEILHPAQQAPMIVVRSADPDQLAEATPAILKLIDPKAATGDDRTGWAYEGFFFEARGSNEVPFLVTFNYWRGPHAGGGQWARSNGLFPFNRGGRAVPRR